MIEATTKQEDPTLPSAGGAWDPESNAANLGASLAHCAIDSVARLRALTETFPTLAARPWGTVHDLLALALDAQAGQGAREAARFVLMVWDGALGENEYLLRFRIRAAWRVWDEAHRRAWQGWAAAPWFA